MPAKQTAAKNLSSNENKEKQTFYLPFYKDVNSKMRKTVTNSPDLLCMKAINQKATDRLSKWTSLTGGCSPPTGQLTYKTAVD